MPKATCKAGDRVEPGLQGQTSLADRQSGASTTAYNCNLELVGQFPGQGSEWQLTWFNDCAYYGTYNTSANTTPGVVVLNAADPAHPVQTTTLNSRAMIDPWESLKVNETRKLLGATKGPGFGSSMPTDRQFAFYDISTDCAHPTLLSDVDVPGHTGHAGNWSPDGQTYYGTGAGGTGFTAMNVSDPAHPTLIGHWADDIDSTHDISISTDGTRAYLTRWGNFVPFGLPGTNGLVILDTTDIKNRVANPAQPKTIGTLYWDDGGVAQESLPYTYNGKPFLIFTDETGVSKLANLSAGRADACAKGLPPFGFARILDLSDETKPKLVAKLMLDVNDPTKCTQYINDFPADTTDLDNYGYSSHYCTPDSTTNQKILACGYWGAGLRVFDIRDPYHPKEIAYYKPPAQGTKNLPGSALWYDYGGKNRTTDRVSAHVRFRNIGSENYLWFVGQDNGFMIVRFTKPMTELLP
ncbi:MAG: LVIVD repeat-containing protein [Myxococcales bacterium]